MSATRFKKRTASKFPSIPGCSPSLHSQQLLTSSGIPALDTLIQGGLTLGSLVLLEDDLASPELTGYSRLVLKYFLAEGAANQHGLIYGGDNREFLQNLPEIVEKEAADKLPTGGTKAEEPMQIAWRYQNQPGHSGGVAPGSSTGHPHSFNLQKPISADKLQVCDHNTWSQSDELSAGDEYHRLFKFIEKELSNQSYQAGAVSGDMKPNVLRIGLEGLGLILFGNDPNFTGLCRFLLSLRSLVRTHLVTCMVTVTGLSPCVTAKVRECSDAVIKLTTFTEKQRSASGFKDHHGFLDIVKWVRFNSLTWQQLKAKYVFRSLKNKFSVDRIHLPPADFGPPDKSEKSTDKSKQSLDF